MNKFKLMVVAGAAGLSTLWLSQAAIAALDAGGASDSRVQTGTYDSARRELITVDRFPLGDAALLDVSARNGSVRVEGWDRPEAELTVTRTLGTNHGFLGWISGERLSEQRTRALLEATNPEVSAGEGVLRVRALKAPYSEPEVAMHFTLRVPRETALRLTSNNGSVEARDVSGTVQVRTNNGELMIERVTGAVVAHADNGRVQLAAIDGDVDVETDNGAIECDGATGAVRLSTTNGAIETRGVRGEALLCTTKNGSIDVNVASGDGCNLDLHTGGGAVECRLPLDQPSDLHHLGLRGTVRGGGQVLALRTDNGSITVGEE